MGINVFNTPGGASIYGPMPQWSCPDQAKNLNSAQQIICSKVGVSYPELETPKIAMLGELDAIGITQSVFSLEEATTIRKSETSICKVSNKYEVPYHSDERPLSNNQAAVGQLGSLVSRMKQDKTLHIHYSRILNNYLKKALVEVMVSESDGVGGFLRVLGVGVGGIKELRSRESESGVGGDHRSKGVGVGSRRNQRKLRSRESEESKESESESESAS